MVLGNSTWECNYTKGKGCSQCKAYDQFEECEMIQMIADDNK